MGVSSVDEVTKGIIITDYLIEQIQKGNEEIKKNLEKIEMKLQEA